LAHREQSAGRTPIIGCYVWYNALLYSSCMLLIERSTGQGILQ